MGYLQGRIVTYQIFKITFYSSFSFTHSQVDKPSLSSGVAQVKFRFYVFSLNVPVLSRSEFDPKKRVTNNNSEFIRNNNAECQAAGHF